MTHKYRKLLSAIALLLGLATVLTGCSLEEFLNFDFLRKLEEETTVPTQPSVEVALPDETTQPPETEPEETVPVETEAEEVVYRVYAEGGLNVRRGPGQEYEIVGRLNDGDEVLPLRWEDGWAYIESPYVGWCSGDHLREVEPDSQRPVGLYWVDTQLQLFKGPGSDYSKSGWIEAGVQVEVLRWDGKWAFVEIGDYYTGWCFGDYLVKSDPFSWRDPSYFLSRRAPKDDSLVGSWLVVSDYTVTDNMVSCHAGLLELKEDGTFRHWVDYYVRMYDGNGLGQWHYPGGDDGPSWVGEYTYDGEDLVLTYRGLLVQEHLFDDTGFPMPMSRHYDKMQKQVSLQVSISEEGIMVDAPWLIPVSGREAKGSETTDPVLYRARRGQEVYEMLMEFYP